MKTTPQATPFNQPTNSKPMNLKPQLAEDADLNTLQFPTILQPKIDGVRALNLNGQLTGRSLDPFKGFGITDYFSIPEFQYLDGEMTLHDKPNSDQRLCSLTTGAMGKFKGVNFMPDLHWWVFDYLAPEVIHLPYEARYEALKLRVRLLDHPRLHVVPSQELHTTDQVKAAIAEYAAAGYEGTIIRNPRSLYKQGRSTKEGQLWRVKPWADFEILVTGVTEGQVNTNEATTNSLGRTERSSAQDGMVPNGQVGSIQGTLLAGFHDPVTGKLLFKKGLPVTAGSGEMSVAEATYFFQNPHLIVNHVAKVKTMTHGVKDLPRFPTFVSLRDPVDMS